MEKLQTKRVIKGPSKLSRLVTYKQCDQMAKIILKYLAICNNENLPNDKSFLPQLDQHFAKYKINPQKNLNFKIVPNWRNFAKSGLLAYKVHF